MKIFEQDSGRWGTRHPLVVFYALAFGISWVGFVPELATMWVNGWFQSPLWLGLLVLPGVGPAVAAWIAGGLTQDGVGGAGQFWSSLTRQVRWPWWVAAIGIPAGSFWMAFSIGGVTVGGKAAVAAASPAGLAGVLGVSVAANVWEEVGWRGFALVRLQRRYGPLMAALIVGVLWAVWHLPLLMIPQSAMSKYPVGLWAVGTVSHSVVLAWMFNRTGRSLGVVTVCHLSWNVFGALFGVRSWGVLALVEVAVALGVIVASRGRLGFVSVADVPVRR